MNTKLIAAVKDVVDQVATIISKTGAGYDGLDDAVEEGSSVRGHLLLINDNTEVPAKDAVTDALSRDVIGKKEDTAQTTVGTTRSIIAYVKGVLNQVATVISGQEGGVAAVNRVIGKLQVAAATIDLNQAAATYTLLTGTTQAVVLEKLVFRMPNVDISGGALTSISIQTDDTTPAVMINTSDGALANLTQEATISWTGAILIPVGTLIQLTIAGGASGVACSCDVMAESRAAVNLGYLA